MIKGQRTAGGWSSQPNVVGVCACANACADLGNGRCRREQQSADDHKQHSSGGASRAMGRLSRNRTGNEVGQLGPPRTGFRQSASDLMYMWDHHFQGSSPPPPTLALHSRARCITMASNKKDMRRIDLSTLSATALRPSAWCYASRTPNLHDYQSRSTDITCANSRTQSCLTPNRQRTSQMAIWPVLWRRRCQWLRYVSRNLSSVSLLTICSRYLPAISKSSYGHNEKLALTQRAHQDDWMGRRRVCAPVVASGDR